MYVVYALRVTIVTQLFKNLVSSTLIGSPICLVKYRWYRDVGKNNTSYDLYIRHSRVACVSVARLGAKTEFIRWIFSQCSCTPHTWRFARRFYSLELWHACRNCDIAKSSPYWILRQKISSLPRTLKPDRTRRRRLIM